MIKNIKMTKYSVIIPHKNIPDLLERCISSIPQREDVEVIVVDDDSTLENRDMAKSACKKHSRTTYIQDETKKGAGHARNVGLENAIGDWAIFSDSDDFFDEGFWPEIDDLLNGSKSDIVYFKDRGVDSETLQPTSPRNHNNTNVTAFLEKKPYSEDRLRFFHTVPWGKVFKRQFLIDGGFRFEEVPVANDVMFSTKTGFHAKEVDARDKVMYVVTRREGSLITKRNKDLLRIRYEVAIRQNLFTQSIGKKRYSFNLFKSIYLARIFGAKEVVWYIKTLIKRGANPFYIFLRL